MDIDENSTFEKVFQLFVYYFPSVIGSLISIVTVIDYALLDSSYIIQPSLDLARQNEAALSVILSALLLFAYLMQYWNQRTQRKIMNRQTSLMQAGYTPILGGSTREWGSQRSGEDPNNIEQSEANTLYLKLSNSGNSTARNLRIWTGIDYDTPSNLECRYDPIMVPLRRTSATSWWKSDQGGAIAPQDSVEFQANPEINRIEKKCIFFDGEMTSISIHTALEEIHEAGVDEIDIAFMLEYTSTTGDDEKIPVGTYSADLSNLSDRDMWIHYAQENEEEGAKDIYDRLT